MTLAPKLMTAEQFLIWRQDQEGTWELVDGVPQPKFYNGPRMMAGGTRNHARVARNLIAALGPRLSGSRCEAYGSDMAVRNIRGQLRQPDVMVECRSGQGQDLATDQPKVIFEVLSPSTRRVDFVLKAEEYRQLPSLTHLVLLEADLPRGLIWTRNGDGWVVSQVEGLDAELTLSDIDLVLPLSEIYARVELSEGD